MTQTTAASPLISVVIVNFNGGKLLEQCLTSVFKTRYKAFEIVLVDNASSDCSFESAQRKFGHDRRLRFLPNDTNLGFAEGNNLGVAVARGDYIAFLNPDTEADPDWLNEALSVLRTNLKAGVCQSKLLSMNDPQKFDSAGDFINFQGIVIRRGGDYGESDFGQYDKVSEIFSARAAAMIVKKEVIDEIGLFDSSFFMTYEDIDFCWRARLRGYDVVLAPKSIVYHVGEAFTPTKFKVFFTTRNWLISLVKNYELKTLTEVLPSVAALTVSIVAAEIFLRRRPDLAMRRIKGILWIVRHFQAIYRDRLRVQYQIRRIPDSEVRKKMLKTNLAVSYWLPLWRRKFV